MDPASIAALASFGSSLFSVPSLPLSAQPSSVITGLNKFSFAGVNLGWGGGGTGKNNLFTASIGTGSSLGSKLIAGGAVALLGLGLLRAAK